MLRAVWSPSRWEAVQTGSGHLSARAWGLQAVLSPGLGAWRGWQGRVALPVCGVRGQGTSKPPGGPCRGPLGSELGPSGPGRPRARLRGGWAGTPRAGLRQQFCQRDGCERPGGLGPVERPALWPGPRRSGRRTREAVTGRSGCRHAWRAGRELGRWPDAPSTPAARAAGSRCPT